MYELECAGWVPIRHPARYRLVTHGTRSGSVRISEDMGDDVPKGTLGSRWLVELRSGPDPRFASPGGRLKRLTNLGMCEVSDATPHVVSRVWPVVGNSPETDGAFPRA